MSAKTVTDKEDGREAVVRAMQEATENASGGNSGVPKGPQGTKGIVVLSNDTSYIPDDKPKKTWGGGGSVEASDEGSETSSIQPRNLSYSSQSARALKSPAKRKKKAKWPPNGDEEEDERAPGDDDEEDDDDDDSGSRHSDEGIDVSIDHANLYEWIKKWTKEHGLPGVAPLGVFNTLCLDVTMDEWLTGLTEANVPTEWAEDGWAGMSPSELVCVFTYLVCLLTLGDLAVESGILAPSQSEMFWSYRQTPVFYAAGSIVHKIVVDLSRMVRVCVTSLTPKKKETEGGRKASRVTYGEKETLTSPCENFIALTLAFLRSMRDAGT